jgi:photosystem II stability/assembly factor-like uncharacterized protein
MSQPAERGADISGAAPLPAQAAASPTSAPPAVTLPSTPAVALSVEVISARGQRGAALKLPSDAPDDARFDVWHAARAGDDRIALIMRPGDVLASSDDEGRTWRVWRSELSMHYALVGVKTWWAVGKLDKRQHATRLIESNDAGRTWRIKATDNNLDPEPYRVAKDNRDLVVATGDDLLWSKDLGNKWKYLSPELNQAITALHVHEGRWWVAGEGGALAHSTNPHKRWHREQLPTSAPIRELAFADDGVVYAATDAGLWRREPPDDPDPKAAASTPGTWREVTLSAQRKLHGVATLSDGAVIAFGVRGALLVSRDKGAQWTDIAQPVRDALKRPPNEALTWRRLVETRDGGWLLFGDDATIVRVSFSI